MSDSQGQLPPLLEDSLPPDPLILFRQWYQQAQRQALTEPTAAALATVDADGQPSARMVLVKDFDDRGFIFYTNYHSRKGQALAADPRAALLFYWDPLARQIRIEGSARMLCEADSDAYFASRPRGSQLGAVASPQSRPLADRHVLERRVDEAAHRYQDRPIPRPSCWGGYRLRPSVIEFWQGRPDRLHDRLRYRREADERWTIERLAP